MNGEVVSLDGPRVRPASGEAKSLVILCHGYGSNGEDLIGLVPHWREALPDTAFVSPNAPFDCPGAPGGFQWWGFGAGGTRSDGVKSAAPILNAFIDAELARLGLSDEHLALVGFSQGTMLSLYVGPRRKTQIAGIVGLSGALIETDDPPITHPPILLVHGDEDPMVPVDAFHRALATLERQGFEVTSHISPGLGHGVDLAGVTLARRFLTKVLA
jgi:phospholipase/carboxylesterase